MYCEDESRFGLITKNGKALTAKGVKPVCLFQQVFQSTYVFGAFSPITGDSFTLELPHCDSQNFQLFLDQFSTKRPDELKIVILDNGAFHKAKALQIPHNIVLVFLPPYSPELNPAEKIWWLWKRKFTNRLFSSLDEVSNFITLQVQKLTKHTIFTLTKFDYILFADFWTNI